MFIYVIGTDTKQKIGISHNTKQRLQTLQTGNPENLVIHHTIEVPDNRARLMERMLHKDYSYLRLKGEWFSMKPELAKSILDFAYIAWVDDPLLEDKV